MTQAVIQRLRRLEGLAIITPAECIRAEHYVERHADRFDAANVTVSQAVDLALESAGLTTEFLPQLGSTQRSSTAYPVAKAWEKSIDFLQERRYRAS